MNQLNIKLTLDEVNKIFNYLGKQPFVDVIDIINNISFQAQVQIQETNPEVKKEGVEKKKA